MKIPAFFALTTLTAAVALTAFTTLNPARLPAATAVVAAAPAVDHSRYDRLLKKHVTDKGLVNYKGFKADEQEFNQYLALLSKNPPAANWSKNEQMVYWINAYNAYTIKTVLNHYPLKSIKEIGSSIQIPFVNTPWADKFFSIGGQKMSLDNIEHGTLRKKYNEPRIHFALVCAALSCPPLRIEAYTAARLDAQLDDQGRAFLNNPAKNNISSGKAQLSKYFDWYKGDWTSNGQSVAKWVNRYSKTTITEQTPVSFLDYNWQLNEQ
ncbi:DUF547 domain-containing protein [Hymenobacter psychrophilus]|uniref:DUF547 domain-containing protein n=1 Tax=Hymenobacter psychrophilus TaxID=651662 RepID=A0A1H3L9X2_9BACT|nr:DUF547 domain-containing protein [Hymenobacter psychrophilus]SDY60754.1 Protein of unknown function, DUF547 [Hymenobacter psychrophilus]